MHYLKVPFSKWLILPLILFFIPLATEMYGPDGLNSVYGEVKGIFVEVYDLGVNEYTPNEKSIRQAALQQRIDRLEQTQETPENLQRAVSFSMGFMMLNLMCSILWMGLNVRLIQNTKKALKKGNGVLSEPNEIMPQINSKDDFGDWTIMSLKTFGFWILAFFGSLASVWLMFLLGLIGVIALTAVSEILGTVAVILWTLYLVTYILFYYIAAQYFYVDTEEVTEGICVARNKKFIARFWDKMFKLYGVIFLWSLIFVPLYFIALMSGIFAIGFGLLAAALLSAYFYSFLSVLYGKYFYEIEQADMKNSVFETADKITDESIEKAVIKTHKKTSGATRKKNVATAGKKVATKKEATAQIATLKTKMPLKKSRLKNKTKKN